MHYLKGQDIDAEISYLKASQLILNDALLLVNLARVYQIMGKKDMAVEAFNRAIGLDPSVKLQYRSMAIELSGAF